ncbi:septation ring formation regulator EzrA [Brevibacillus marinus]|uniref:septation ring formation regulator EzrA n=1 Tax=Brevibacillus marinus TaxID=2496837 RepID=UPI0013DF22CA|nr:septation ring formation regulator EzrA [Brevibacillus marinus]
MKLRLLMLLLIAVGVLPVAAWAAPFPAKTDEVVQDEDGFLDEQEKQSFSEFVKQYSDVYKLVVVESVEPEAATADEYARQLYDHYNLPENALMIVLDAGTQELGVYPGPALQEKGADLELLHEKIETYYKPFSSEKKYLAGIQTFIAETHNELEQGTAQADTAAGGDGAASAPEPNARPESGSLWSLIPWWVYALAVLFLLFLAALLYAFVRRNAIFAEVDRIEDWKDEVVEKIQAIDLDKPLRRATGATEEWYAQLANRKENLLRMKIPDVEMIILEAEEACERLRFQAARELLAEGEELLTELEAELAELKTDSTKAAEKKNENTHQLPELEKLAEQCGRKLTNARLDYGLTFHELKDQLDEAEKLRGKVKELLAAGDTMQAYELAKNAQEILQGLVKTLERLPELVNRVQKEMVEELKQLEDDIALLIRDGHALNQNLLEAVLLPVKQLLISAETALEEGNLGQVEMHVKAFSIKMDEAYQSLEEAVLGQRQSAIAAASSAERAGEPELELDLAPAAAAGSPYLSQPAVPAEPNGENKLDEAGAELAGAGAEPAARDALAVPAEADREDAASVPADWPEAGERMRRATIGLAGTAELEDAAERPWPDGSSTSQEERWLLLERASAGRAEEQPPADFAPARPGELERAEEQEEYELVIRKPRGADGAEAAAASVQLERVRIESEDDALDLIEHISNSLIRIRQQLKRGYLPGIPDEVVFHFEQVVQTLGRVKLAMDRYRYEIEEVAELLLEAQEELALTQKLAEEAIRDCQRAEGAIQYTNRYRRQNRQVHELLSKAEQAFRQLRFAEALSLAEEARLLVEGEEAADTGRSGWLLRRKRKGAGE